MSTLPVIRDYGTDSPIHSTDQSDDSLQLSAQGETGERSFRESRFANNLREKTSPQEKKNIIPFYINPRPVFSIEEEKELQWWLGEIIEIKHDSFKAILEDLNERINYAEFESDPEELAKLKIGTKFAYSVSEFKRAGRREYKSKLAFSYPKPWLKKYEENIEEISEEIIPAHLLELYHDD